MRRLMFAALLLPPVTSFADAARPILVQGRVPDEETRQALLRRLRAAHPGAAVKDELATGQATASANWSRDVGAVLDTGTAGVVGAVLAVDGDQVRLEGSVPDEATRTAVLQRLQNLLGGGYSVVTDLRVEPRRDSQKILDRTLGNRTVQFESGSAVLTAAGTQVLDEMAAAISQVGTPALDVIGHTDSAGDRQANILLSMARADAVKAYLTRRGIESSRMVVSGRGPDQPLADNATPAGRARNRRIEFLIRQ